MDDAQPEPTALQRSISLPMLIFYGVGTMVGGGFYALLGEVAGEAGMATPFALILSGLLALISATSFAELSSRYPVSAGEVRYVRMGFGRADLAAVIGVLVILTGIVSAATLAVATIGFLRDLADINESLGIALLVVAMGAVAAWGVGKSVALVAIITVIEVGALVVVAILAGDNLADLPDRGGELFPASTDVAWAGVFAGGFLAFYAFIGFEDMVNMAEEVKRPRRNLPIAILVSVVLTIIIYVLFSTVAVLAVPPEELAESATPIAEVAGGDGWFAGTGLVLVSMLTGINGALVQIIMASRVSYGMAKRGQAPSWFGLVVPVTRTPVFATAVMTGVVLALALYFPLVTLAETTSTMILVVFAFVNLSLWRIKRMERTHDESEVRFPTILPLIGFIASIGVLAYRAWDLSVG
jgi:amino acid transporter